MGVRRECAKCGGFGKTRTGLLARVCSTCSGSGFTELSNVVHAPIVTKLDLDASQVLREAIGELDEVVIVGYTKDGHDYYASSMADGANALWHLQRGIHSLMNIVEEETDE